MLSYFGLRLLLSHSGPNETGEFYTNQRGDPERGNTYHSSSPGDTSKKCKKIIKRS